MKVYVNLPEDTKDLNDKVANLHATLLIHKIQSLSTDDKTQKKILNLVLDDLKKYTDD